MTWQPIDTAPKDGVSLAHARLRALQILTDTEVRIQLERQKEFASLFAATESDLESFGAIPARTLEELSDTLEAQ